MKTKYTILIELNLDKVYIGDLEDKEWLENSVLTEEGELTLFSNMVGDCVGEVKVLKILLENFPHNLSV
jgi:hypothetical protein